MQHKLSLFWRKRQNLNSSCDRVSCMPLGFWTNLKCISSLQMCLTRMSKIKYFCSYLHAVYSKDYSTKNPREKWWEGGLEVRQWKYRHHMKKCTKRNFVPISQQSWEFEVSSLSRSLRLTGDYTGVRSGCTSNNWLLKIYSFPFCYSDWFVLPENPLTLKTS